MNDAPDAIRCSKRLTGQSVTIPYDALRCVLPYDHEYGHVFASGSFVPDRHKDD
jgi:hypothetical protein